MLARLENLLLGLAALAVMALGLLIAGNVVARAVFGASLPDSIILVQELMVAAIVLPLAAATAARAHVSVDFITNRTGPRFRSWCIALGSVVGLLALMPLIYAGGRDLLSSWGSGSFFYGDLGLPKWPGRLIFVIGLGSCLLRLAQLALRDIRAAARGEAIDDSHNPTEVE